MARVLLVLALLAGPAAAQPVTLRESATLTRAEIALRVEGKLKVERGGKADAIPLSARARVAFAQYADAPGRAVRLYDEARSTADTGLEHAVRALGPDRRLIGVTRTDAGAVHFSPDGPLTREELELVGEHFDVIVLPDLLPPGPVARGATWPVAPEAARRALHFDALGKAELVATLVEVTDAAATVSITGAAEGAELGAAVQSKVKATLTFDRQANLVTRVEWAQDDVRGQGPASPATELTATVAVTRASLSAEPAELAAGRARLPAGGVPTGANAMLKYADPSGRYQFLYARAWHVVGRTAEHLTLRLVEGGEFVAQATVTAWKPAAPGGHTTAAEFQALLAKLPGWVPGGVVAAGEVPTDAGRWLYRVAATGSQDGVAVAQAFYLLAGPGGDQVAVTVLARPGAVGKLGTRDAELVNGVEFPARK